MNQINRFRMTVLLNAMTLELKGYKRRGRSCFAIVREEFGLEGTRQKVYEKFTKIVHKEREASVEKAQP